MNASPDLENLLRSLPSPEPPPQLLAQLERQLETSFAPARAPVRPRRLFWQRAWQPLTGLGLAGLAAYLILGVVVLGTGTHILAQSLQALTRVKSFRVVERIRSGPAKPVIKDPTKLPQDSPNYLTSIHPGNPFMEIQHAFKADSSAPGQGRIHSVSPQGEKWQTGNVILEVDAKTGQRKITLDSSPTMFGGIAAPVMIGAQSNPAFKELDPAKVPDLPAGQTATIAVYEFRYQIEVNERKEEHIERVWLDRTSHLPLRVQFLGTVWQDIAPEVLLEEYIFSDFDTDIPDSTFAIIPTDSDLAPLGITAADLAKLPATAFSVRLYGYDGSAGAEVKGTIKDQSGTREIHGVLPFGFIYVPDGDAKFDFRMTDGKARNFGIQINGNDMNTVTDRIHGEVTSKGTSMQGG